MEFTGIDDIEYLRNKMMAALKVPKAFLGYDEALGGKATLAAEDVRFARTIERIQRIVISELYKIAIVHLYSQGYTDAELVDFELTMTSPSTIYEQEKLTLYNTKVDLAGSMLEKKIMSKDWIFKNLFNFTADEIMDIEEGIIQDQKDTFRMTKISEDGEDPADPRNKESKSEGEGEEGGEEKEGGKEKEGGEENPFEEGYEYKLRKKYENEAKSKRTPKGGWPGAGRPKEGVKYNTHEHPRGYDPLGSVAWKNARGSRLESTEPVKKYGLAKLDSKKQKMLTENNSSILNEKNILSEEI